MTTEEALRVIYEARGLNVHRVTDGVMYFTRPKFPLPHYPLADITEGLAEFARLVVWAFSEGFYLTHFDNKYACLIHSEIKPYRWSKAANTPQEAFILALAAALEARKKGGE